MAHHPVHLPIAVLGTYTAGYLAGRSIAVLWSEGEMAESGIRRLRTGAAECARRALRPRVSF